MGRLRHRDEVRSGQLSVLASLLDGVRYLVRNRTLTGILVVTVIFNVFGFPFLSMVPVIGREQLDLSASAIGLLASLEGVGVLAGALALILWLRERQYRRVYFFGVVLFEVGGVLFGQAAGLALSAAALLLAGLAGAAFSVMQSTLVMLCAEPAARTRMMGVLSVCIGTGPAGFLHLGWLAEQVGASAAVTIMGIEGLLALWLAARMWPELLAPQPAL
jgi:predicted MFS family arabinose efflux permease